MLAMKPLCERCRRDLPADQNGALICSFECTFCGPCAETTGGRCPNCSGDLQPRPMRSGALLERYPAALP